MKKALAVLAATGLIATFAGSASAKPVSVFTDASGDSGFADNPGVPGTAEAGFDLVGGTIDKAGKDLAFTVTHSAMPATNQPGETFRFLWHFDVGGKQYRFTVKSLDIGKPDVVAQTGNERVGQIYQGVARLEEGYVDATLPLQLSQFKTLEYLEATFDPAAKTVTWKLPLAALKLKAGSVINPGTGGSTATGCQICWIPHYAERSLTPQTIIDAATMSVVYKVPR